MIFDLPYEQLARLWRSWREYQADGRPLYGFGLANGLFQGNFLAEGGLPLTAILDNDQSLWNGFHRRHLVLPPRKALESPGRALVFSLYFRDIREQLLNMGLVEFDDFLRASHYLALRHWFGGGKIYFESVVFPVTTSCSLNCEGCNMLMTEYGPRETFSLESLKSDADLFFSQVDFLRDFALFGGEPLLSPVLPELIDYLAVTYNGRFDRLIIDTNGTIAPTEALVSAAARHGVHFYISDYQAAGIPRYQEKINALKTTFETAGAPYAVIPMPGWAERRTDDPHLAALSPEELKVHYNRCSYLDCMLFHDGRLYACATAWSAHKAGLCELSAEDGLDFRRFSREKAGVAESLLRASLGRTPRGCFEFCRQCRGTDREYFKPLAVARQKERKNA